MDNPTTTNRRYWCNKYVTFQFDFVAVHKVSPAPLLFQRASPGRESRASRSFARRQRAGCGVLSAVHIWWNLSAQIQSRMQRMPLEYQWRISVEITNFTLSSFYPLRRDMYEKDLKLFWYEGNLKAKKLNLGQSLMPRCQHKSHIDTHITTLMVVGNPNTRK